MKKSKSKVNIEQYLKKGNINSLQINLAQKKIEKIRNIFSEKERINKAIRPQSIPTHILKECRKPLSIPLTIIINISHLTRNFLELCEIAHVTTVFTKVDQIDYSDYRPISLLSNINKVLEK